MKKLIVSVLFFCVVMIAKSQNLIVEGNAPNLYITHIVAPKENFYSVGRLYNQAPKSIAAFNNITMEKGLTIGQHIKIPLNAQNLETGGKTDEKMFPLTHIVAKNETLFKIANDLNVTPSLLKNWNSLSSDNIKPGTPLVVGHLKMQGATVATKVINTQAATNKETTTAKEPVPAPKQTVSEAKKEDVFTAVKPAASDSQNETSPMNAETSKQTDKAVTAPAQQPAVKENTTPAQVKEEPAKPKETVQTNNDEGKRTDFPATANTNLPEGAFAGNYTMGTSQKSINTKSGEAATFKSTSGWQDKKYYVLMNDIVPGTILKIASADNKVVYAKVLGSMPEMKENTGLLLRISNAAASFLGIIDPKFPVQISYYQ